MFLAGLSRARVLFALLLGMAMHFLVKQRALSHGVEFVATHVLRVGLHCLVYVSVKLPNWAGSHWYWWASQ
jgi:uncharacterized membrane protein YadS